MIQSADWCSARLSAGREQSRLGTGRGGQGISGPPPYFSDVAHFGRKDAIGRVVFHARYFSRICTMRNRKTIAVLMAGLTLGFAAQAAEPQDQAVTDVTYAGVRV